MDIKVMAGIAGVITFLIVVIYMYNKLVRLRLMVRNAWSDIDVHLKKRYELIPNLCATVKAYAGHEKETLTQVTRLRAEAVNSASPRNKARADGALMQTVSRLIVLVEAYPDLKADAHYRQLMTDLKEIEGNIEHARRFYNVSVRDYNIASSLFPTNIVASAFAFTPEEFFALDDELSERKPVAIGLE